MKGALWWITYYYGLLKMLCWIILLKKRIKDSQQGHGSSLPHLQVGWSWQWYFTWGKLIHSVNIHNSNNICNTFCQKFSSFIYKQGRTRQENLINAKNVKSTHNSIFWSHKHQQGLCCPFCNTGWSISLTYLKITKNDITKFWHSPKKVRFF